MNFANPASHPQIDSYYERTVLGTATNVSTNTYQFTESFGVNNVHIPEREPPAALDDVRDFYVRPGIFPLQPFQAEDMFPFGN